MDKSLNVEVTTEIKLYTISALVESKINGKITDTKELFLCNITAQQFEQILKLAESNS